MINYILFLILIILFAIYATPRTTSTHQIPTAGRDNCAVALLELTGIEGYRFDQFLQVNFEYLQELYGFRFPMIDTGGSIENAINLLDQYYNRGYRVFLGISRSELVRELIPWFDERPDALGISLSTAQSLAIRKNIVRLNISSAITYRHIAQFANQYPNSLIILETGSISLQDARDAILPFIQNETVVELDLSQPQGIQQARNLVAALPPNSLVILLSALYKSDYVNAVANLPNLPDHLDPTALYPEFSHQSARAFDRKYYFMTRLYPPSLTARQMEAALRDEFLEHSLDAYKLAWFVCRYGNKDLQRRLLYMEGYTGDFILDDNNDRILTNDAIYLYIEQNWVPQIIYAYSSALGNYSARIIRDST